MAKYNHSKFWNFIWRQKIFDNHMILGIMTAVTDMYMGFATRIAGWRLMIYLSLRVWRPSLGDGLPEIMSLSIWVDDDPWFTGESRTNAPHIPFPESVKTLAGWRPIAVFVLPGPNFSLTANFHKKIFTKVLFVQRQKHNVVKKPNT